MATQTKVPISVTFLLWKPGEKPQKEARRFRHAATVNLRQRKVRRAKDDVQGLMAPRSLLSNIRLTRDDSAQQEARDRRQG